MLNLKKNRHALLILSIICIPVAHCMEHKKRRRSQAVCLPVAKIASTSPHNSVNLLGLLPNDLHADITQHVVLTGRPIYTPQRKKCNSYESSIHQLDWRSLLRFSQTSQKNHASAMLHTASLIKKFNDLQYVKAHIANGSFNMWHEQYINHISTDLDKLKNMSSIKALHLFPEVNAVCANGLRRTIAQTVCVYKEINSIAQDYSANMQLLIDCQDEAFDPKTCPLVNCATKNIRAIEDNQYFIPHFSSKTSNKILEKLCSEGDWGAMEIVYQWEGAKKLTSPKAFRLLLIPHADNYALRCLQLLTGEGRPVNVIINADGSTPLHVAIQRRVPIAMIKLLVERGADIDALNDDSTTPLRIALMQLAQDFTADTIAVVKVMLNSPANKALAHLEGSQWNEKLQELLHNNMRLSLTTRHLDAIYNELKKG